jgi:hypothetical protein
MAASSTLAAEHRSRNPNMMLAFVLLAFSANRQLAPVLAVSMEIIGNLLLFLVLSTAGVSWL